MPQYRYHNFEAPLVSIDENNRLVGLASPGVYAGFDNFEVVSGTTIKMIHTSTGAKRLKEDGTVDEGPFGVIVSRQGTVVYDDTEVQIAIPFITTNPRRDLIVAQHTHLDSPGGSSLTYSRIAGAEAVNPVLPALTNPFIQIPIAEVKVLNTGDHLGTVWLPMERTSLGGQHVFGKGNDRDVKHTRENNFNLLNKSGIYSMNTTLNAPNVSTPHWVVIVMRRANNMLVQLALHGITGKAFTRAATNFTTDPVTNWQPWQSLSNADVPGVDLTPLLIMIGNLTYTEQNIVEDQESLTVSVDKLDQILNDVVVLSGSNSTAINNIQTELASVFSSISDAIANIDNATIASVRYIRRVSAQPGTWPDGTLGSTLQLIVTRGSYTLPGPIFVTEITQQLYHFATGATWSRGSTNNGSTWSAWALRIPARKEVNIGTWDMDTDNAKSVPHGLTDITKIRSISIMIRRDDGSEVYDFLGEKSSTNTFERSGSINVIDATNIYLNRAASGSGGSFDSSNFSSVAGGFNRGWVTIEYIPH